MLSLLERDRELVARRLQREGHEKHSPIKSKFAGVIAVFPGEIAILAANRSKAQSRIAKAPESVLKISPTIRVDRRFVSE
jgi:hypothetical protein